QHVFRTLAAWGFDFFKVDFMYAGALSGRRHSDTSGVAAYREAVRLIREAIGPNATLLGCGAPILPSLGLYDAMRVSPDVGPLHAPDCTTLADSWAVSGMRGLRNEPDSMCTTTWASSPVSSSSVASRATATCASVARTWATSGAPGVDTWSRLRPPRHRATRWPGGS